jgi:hypothetical protein
VKKEFFANIDGDKLSFFVINLNADGSLVDPIMEDKDYALSNSPTVLNITNLGYFPARKSIWDGESFTSPSGQEHKPACGACKNGCETIAFLVDNVYYGGIGYCVGVATNDMLIAALSSRPEITFELLEE